MSNKFSQRSLDKLATCDQRLVDIAHDVLKVFDISILCGARTPSEQDILFKKGESKLRGDDVRARHVPRDKHGRYKIGGKSLAVDWAPYVGGTIPWKSTMDWVYVAGLWMMSAEVRGVKLRWGGNWDMDNVILRDQTFQDLGHVEIVE